MNKSTKKKKKFCLSKKNIGKRCKQTCKKRPRRNHNKKIQYGCKKIMKGGSMGLGFIDSFRYAVEDFATSSFNTILGNNQIPSSPPMYDQFNRGENLA
tara:strand:- start:466 stop:759 length:294 start_codon:yes stop_codon:yes gene_type:complete